MKKLLLGIVLFLLMSTVARAQGLVGEHIRSFHLDATIQKDGTIQARETIIYDFADLSGKHGIYRYIPYVREETDGKKYKMEVKLTSVTDDQNRPHEYAASTADDKFAVKIGDPDKTVRGSVTYVITYTVKGAVKYYEDHDELYWNLNGFGWSVPIATLSSRVVFPDGVGSAVKSACFTGHYGSTATNCTSSIGGAVATFATTQSLSAGENMSIVVGFPKDIVAYSPAQEVVPFFETLLGRITLGIIVIVAILWYAVLPIYLGLRWYRYGRDPAPPQGPVSAWYSPPKGAGGHELTPGEVGALADERVQTRDIQATIVDLARRGYFNIQERAKKDFYFLKQPPPKKDTLQGFESTLLAGLFEYGDELHLKGATLYKTIDKARGMMYKELVADGFFTKNPNTTRMWYGALTFISLVTANIPLFLSSLIFGQGMPRKTMKGAEAAAQAKSLRNFLSSQTRQLEFQAKHQYWFEKLLPYAVAFGVEKVWARRFDGIELAPPQWYSGYSGGHFTASSFTNSLDSSMTSFATASTPPSSSGSGFSGGSSGGGGGGGGGGSW